MAIDIEAPGANEADLQRALSNLREFRGCRVRMTADDTTQNVTSETAVSFDSATFDTDSFWSAGTPNRITIPNATITYVDLDGQVSVSSSTPDTTFTASIFHKNSGGTTQAVYGSRFIECGGSSKQLCVSTGPIAVSNGDYFELTVREETDNSVTIVGNATGHTCLALNVLGMNPA